jgi:hypothetical protein
MLRRCHHPDLQRCTLVVQLYTSTSKPAIASSTKPPYDNRSCTQNPTPFVAQTHMLGGHMHLQVEPFSCQGTHSTAKGDTSGPAGAATHSETHIIHHSHCSWVGSKPASCCSADSTARATASEAASPSKTGHCDEFSKRTPNH